MLYLIVSGLPAAGKSTVASRLAEQSGLPLLDKDQFLESLFARSAPRDPAEGRVLSARADVELGEAARRAPGAIIVSWWRHPASDADSGTATAWLHELPGRLVELHCECPPETALRRFRRRERHPGTWTIAGRSTSWEPSSPTRRSAVRSASVLS